MVEFSKPLRLTLSAQILQQVERCIKDGLWPVGEKIPGELELMSEFSVSRNTVREAIQALCFAGVLQTRPGDGTYILCRDKFDAALHKRLQQAHLTEVLETRFILETNIAFLAAERGTAEDIVSLRAALLAREEELPDREFISADSVFHLRLAAMCHNPLLYDMYTSLISFLEELVAIYLEHSGRNRQHREHRDLYAAIADRQGEAAAEIVRLLVEAERDTFQQAGLLPPENQSHLNSDSTDTADN